MKILAVGNVNLESSLPKILAICAKHSFELVLAGSCSVDAVTFLSNKLVSPVPIYFYSAEPSLVDAFEKHAFPPNFILMDGLYTTSSGLRIGYYSGGTPFQGSVDILYTLDWPMDIWKGSKEEESLGESTGETRVNSLVESSTPRYHFSSLQDCFFEREPFTLTSKQSVVRFINLGHFESGSKAKWYYAFNIIPRSEMDESALLIRPSNTTPTPWTRDKKRSAEEESSFFFDQGSEPVEVVRVPPPSYICRICGIPGHYIQECPDKRDKRRKVNEAVASRDASKCWFCLSNDDIESHLIVTVINATYLSIAKGGLVPHHVLLVPVEHVASTPMLHVNDTENATEVTNELKSVKEKVIQYFRDQGECVAAFEIYGGENPSNPRMHHMHIQIVPLPMELKESLESTFIVEATRSGYCQTESIPTNASFITFQVDDGPSLVFVPEGPSVRFNHFLPRLVLSKLMGNPDLKDWKKCVLPKDEEEFLALKLRESLDPLLQIPESE